ncbi:MAG: hypothetical protein IPL46_04570 [Saprospiraceae bacterium]|nr:hypothetical protein [Saprospiraceae bacterium]
MQVSILAIFFVFFGNRIFAQAKPSFFPEDISPDGISVRCFCKPGVINKSRTKGLEISYTWLGAGTFADEQGNFSAPLSRYKNWLQLEFDFKVPVINKEHLKILFGYKFSQSLSTSASTAKITRKHFKHLMLVI